MRRHESLAFAKRPATPTSSLPLSGRGRGALILSVLSNLSDEAVLVITRKHSAPVIALLPPERGEIAGGLLTCLML
jgi:hypothetical protein